MTTSNTWEAAPAKPEAPGNNIHLWLCDLNINEQIARDYYEILSSEEKARHQRFKLDQHKKLFNASHGFLRNTLARYVKSDAHQLQFETGENGKPELTDSQSIQFNLSHAGELALLAICNDDAIGVDIEYVDRKVDWQGIIKRYFTEAEQKNIFDLSENERQRAFIQVWARKESYMKLSGHGLSLSPGDFTVTVPPSPPALIEHMSTKHSQPERSDFFDIALPEQYEAYCASCAHMKNEYDVIYYKAGNRA